MLYQVDSKGEVRSVELQVTLPQGDCGMEPAFSLQPLPPWQIFVPYLGDRESRLIVVEFAFESMPVLRVKADVDEDRLRTFGLFANRRFLARSGDKVDLEFDKRGFSEPIVIAGV
jgi:hypothetical protein